MENHRFRSAKNEREDFRTFPQSVRRVLPKKGEFFKSLKEGMNAKLGKEARLVQKAEALKGQYRLESNRR